MAKRNRRNRLNDYTRGGFVDIITSCSEIEERDRGRGRGTVKKERE